MDLKSKLPYHKRLLLLLLVSSWVLVACFVVFQYGREKHFKAEQLNSELQLFNIQFLDALTERDNIDSLVRQSKKTFDEQRITLIDLSGKVLFDSSSDTASMTNHLDRPEVRQALGNGTGYVIRRHSESTHLNYFYSATRNDSLIVRSAVPYSVSLREVLAADREFLWFMLGITLLMSIGGYFATRRLGHNITRLNEFAERAERGERIDDSEPFPHDELGNISNHLIRLYARLQKTKEDRDREHALALHEEQEKIRIKRQLTNNINHELKTPVAAIRGYLETLLAHPELSEEKRTEFLKNGYAQSERLQRLLNDVSTVVRMDEGSVQIRKEPSSLNEFIEEIDTEMELRPQERQLRVHCDFPPHVEIEGNPSLIGSIFRNLADNASAYSGGSDIYIRLLDDTAEEYRISFADNGVGVGEEHLSHLFERFYRVDKGRSRKMGGTGLGLAIVKHAVLFHGGTISVHNRKEGGLEFIFTLKKHA